MKYLLNPQMVLFGLIFLVAIVFSPHLNNGLVFDDHPQIEENPIVQGERPISHAFTQGVWAHKGEDENMRDRYYRPLFTVANHLVHQLGNGNPIGFHLLSLSLHIIATLLAFVTLRVLQFSDGVALSSAALFSLSPLAGEVVFWASCISEPMALISLMLTIICMVKAGTLKDSWRVLWIVAATTSLLFGLFSKETAVIIAPIVTLEVLRHRREQWTKRFSATAPLWIATLIFLGIRAQFVSSSLGELLPQELANVGHYGLALGWFALKLLFPYPLSPLHPFPLHPSPSLTLIGFAVLVGLILLCLFFIGYKREQLMWLGWLLFPLCLPMIPLLFTYEQAIGSPVAERYLYLSLIPWCVFLVFLGKQLLEKLLKKDFCRLAQPALCLMVCLLGGVILSSYGNVFQNDKTYFQKALAYNPQSTFVLSWLSTLENREKNFQSSLSYLMKIRNLDPKMAHLNERLGYVNYNLKRIPEAIQFLQSALQETPRKAGIHYLLGKIFHDMGQLDKAAFHYQNEVRIDPENVAALGDLGICLYLLEDFNGAFYAWEKALQVEEIPTIRFNLGKAYRDHGQREKAAYQLSRFMQTADKRFDAQRRMAQQWLQNL